MAEISVIVPVYKVEKYLHRCVRSILQQSFRDFELILVDDGSPDRCGDICDAYAVQDSRVHVIHQENGGLSAARNRGIEWSLKNSDSRWIAFVDSDDWVHPDYLKLLYRAVTETGFPMAACGFACTEGEPLGEVSEEYRKLTADEFYCGDGIPSGRAPVAWNKLYRKDLLEGTRYPIGKLNEDEFVTYRLVYRAQQVAYVPAALYAYFQNREGIMLSRWSPRRLHVLEAIVQQMEDAKSWGNDVFYRKTVRHYIYAIHEQLCAAEVVFHKELRKKYRTALKLGKKTGVFPLNWDSLWAYEEAYPVKPFWWLLFKGRAVLGRLFGKDGEV